MRKQVEAGVNLVPHPACDKVMTRLRELLARAEDWEQTAKDCLNAKYASTFKVCVFQ